MRIAPAARQLVQQVQALHKNAEVEYGEADGLGFSRSVTFDPKTSKAIAKSIDALGDDRIAEATMSKGKVADRRLTVRFVTDTRADFRTPYPLAEVDAILNEPDDSE